MLLMLMLMLPLLLCLLALLPESRRDKHPRIIMSKKRKIRSKLSSDCFTFRNLLITATILNYFTQLSYLLNHLDYPIADLNLPRIILAEAIECRLDSDCGNKEKICHEFKCICARDRPIEDQDRCLSLSLINEPCALTEQCLGSSLCVDGICSCGNDAISLYNPSTKIFYCHPKRRLNEECNYDSQCPANSYCSTKNSGCLCQNGYIQTTISSNNSNSSNISNKPEQECLAKVCTDSSNCESDIYECEDNKCKCLATHFDPHNGKCYKFGSTGGKPLEELKGNSSVVSDDTNFRSIMKDLMENSDKMWLVLMILISLSILLFVLIFMLIRGYCRGYCWTARKKEYEPNNKNQPKDNNYFNKSKNAINNKSFRQKNGDVEDDDNNDVVEDRSNLVTPMRNEKKRNGNSAAATGQTPFMTKTDKTQSHNYVKVNINESHLADIDSSLEASRYQTNPLASSTSTPV